MKKNKVKNYIWSIIMFVVAAFIIISGTVLMCVDDELFFIFGCMSTYVILFLISVALALLTWPNKNDKNDKK